MAKSTYGTGCFLLINTGERLLKSRNQLLGTVACRLQGKSAMPLKALFSWRV
ncbi:MAG: hypothetical protein OXD01_01990 [Gammaproteobacteria bacterium]|nr:hypothetical protein [Gammaproteobacteria bacterium]